MTQYHWPTWADIIANEIPESYNYGRTGAGNIYISNLVAECNMRYKFNSDDLIIIMWSTITREDRYLGKQWHCHGNIYYQSFYDEEFLEKYVDNRGQLIRDLGLITLTEGMLNSIGCDYHMLAMQPMDLVIRDDTDKLEGEYKDVIDLYQPTMDKILPDLLCHGCNGKWPQTPIARNVPGGQSHDYHPTPRMHLGYLKNIFPDTNYSPSTMAMVEKYEFEIGKSKYLEDLSWNVPLQMPPLL